MATKLRYFATCGKHGVKSEPELQFWHAEYGHWCTIPYIECKEEDEEEYMHDEDACY